VKLAGPTEDECGATLSQEFMGPAQGRQMQGWGGTTTFCICTAVGKGFEVF